MTREAMESEKILIARSVKRRNFVRGWSDGDTTSERTELLLHKGETIFNDQRCCQSCIGSVSKANMPYLAIVCRAGQPRRLNNRPKEEQPWRSPSHVTTYAEAAPGESAESQVEPGRLESVTFA